MRGRSGGGGGCQSSWLAVAVACCQRHYPPTPTCPPATSHTSHIVTHFFLGSEHLGSAQPHTACSRLLRVWASVCVCVCVLQKTLRCPSTESTRTVLKLHSHQARPSMLHSLPRLSHIYVSVLQSFPSHRLLQQRMLQVLTTAQHLTMLRRDSPTASHYRLLVS